MAKALVDRDDIERVVDFALQHPCSDREVRASLMRLSSKVSSSSWVYRGVREGASSSWVYRGVREGASMGTKISIIEAYQLYTKAPLMEAKDWVESAPHPVSSALAKLLLVSGAVVTRDG